jgi:hypothetical protein
MHGRTLGRRAYSEPRRMSSLRTAYGLRATCMCRLRGSRLRRLSLPMFIVLVTWMLEQYDVALILSNPSLHASSRLSVVDVYCCLDLDAGSSSFIAKHPSSLLRLALTSVDALRTKSKTNPSPEPSNSLAGWSFSHIRFPRQPVSTMPHLPIVSKHRRASLTSASYPGFRHYQSLQQH